jgi:predicted RNA-binding protein YlxR (DUF448 family)
MCTGCRKREFKPKLIKIAKIKLLENSGDTSTKIFIDRTNKSHGRGTYLCKNINCLKKAKKAKKFERLFSFKTAQSLYLELEKELGAV